MEQRCLKVLLVGHGLGFEGAPRSFVNLALGLAAQDRMRPEVIVHEDGPLRAQLTAAGIPVHVLPGDEAGPPLPDDASGLDIYVAANLRFLRGVPGGYDRALEALASTVAALAPDVIIANTVLCFWAIGVGAQRGIPTMWIIHESEEPFSHLRVLGEQVMSRLPGYLDAASKVVFVSRATQRLFTTVGTGKNFTVIPNALFPDMPVFDRSYGTRRQAREALGIPPETVSLLLLGSVFERKGQIDLVRAMGLLPPEMLERVRCDFVGDRPGTDYSLRFHAALDALPENVRSRIKVHRETSRVAMHYAAADVFVFCSRIESSPLAILEALCMDLPIISTPVFGVTELVDTTCALFYEPGDITALTRHIETVIRCPGLRQCLAMASHNRYRALPDHNAVITSYASAITRIAAPDAHPLTEPNQEVRQEKGNGSRTARNASR